MIVAYNGEMVPSLLEEGFPFAVPKITTSNMEMVLRSLFVCSLIAFHIIWCQSKSTAWPVLGTLGDCSDEYPGDEEIQWMANNFSFLSFSCNNEYQVATKLRKYNTDIPIVSYVGSWGVDNDYVDEDHERAEQYPFALLSESISDSDITFSLILDFKYKNADKIPLLSSTVTGNKTISCKEFVAFIRIDNEYMKVTKITKSNNSPYEYTIKVDRGLQNKPSSHNINSIILAPAFIQVPPNCDDIPHYSINIQSQYATIKLVDATINMLNNSMNGSYYDMYVSKPHAAKDYLSNSLQANDCWNFRANRCWTNDTEFRYAQG